ncbi:hypothetical protein D3C87_2138280 [compost metagenome]
MTDFTKVWTKSAQRIGAELANCAPIAEGAGSSTGGTLAPRVTISQTTSRATPNTAGISSPMVLRGTVPLRISPES